MFSHVTGDIAIPGLSPVSAFPPDAQAWPAHALFCLFCYPWLIFAAHSTLFICLVFIYWDRISVFNEASLASFYLSPHGIESVGVVHYITPALPLHCSLPQTCYVIYC